LSQQIVLPNRWITLQCWCNFFLLFQQTRILAMKSIILALIPALCLALFHAAPASALNLKSWMASDGLDSNDCSRATPCQTFNGALAKTDPFGEILCVDAITLGTTATLTISKSITLNCENGPLSLFGSVISNPLVVVTIGAADQVVLRGIDFDLGISTSGNSALNFDGAGTLIVDRAKITGGKAATSNGILFQPNGAGRLIMTDSIVTGAGNGTTGAGIRIVPQAGGTAQVTIRNSNVSGNTFGIAADGTGSTNGINATIADSVMASNVNDGVIAVTSGGGAPIGVMIKNSNSINNGFGVRSIGSGVTVRVNNATVIGNVTGLSALSGSDLLSAGNNTIESNGTNGAFTDGYTLR
jgi:hypothetical protein